MEHGIPFGEKARLGLKVLGARLLGRRLPLAVGWAVTDRCNRRCLYCDRRGGAAPRDLETGDLLAIVDDLARLGTRIVTFSGGEPLLRDDFGTLVDRAHGHGMVTKMSTNGALFVERSDELRRLRAVAFSLDGPEEVNDALRGDGTYAAVMAAAARAREMGLSLSFAAVLTRQNLDTVDPLLEIAASYGATATFQPAETFHDREAVHSLAPPVERYREVMAHLMKRKREGAPVGNSLAGLAHLARWPDPAPVTCAGGRISARIEADGAMYVCSRYPDGAKGIDCRAGGCAGAFASLTPVACERCWFANGVELSLVYGLSPAVVLEKARRFF